MALLISVPVPLGGHQGVVAPAKDACGTLVYKLHGPAASHGVFNAKAIAFVHEGKACAIAKPHPISGTSGPLHLLELTGAIKIAVPSSAKAADAGIACGFRIPVAIAISIVVINCADTIWICRIN